MRGAFEKLLGIGDSLERPADLVLIGLGNSCLAGNLLDVIAISFGSRYATSGGVRLFQHSRVGQISHHVADGRRA